MSLGNLCWIFHMQHYAKAVLLLVLLIILLQGFHMMYIMQLQEKHPKFIAVRNRAARTLSRLAVKPDDLRSYIDRMESAHIMDRSGTYMFVPNIVTPTEDQSISNQTSVTVCAQSTAEHLHYLRELSTDWDGPISVTVFTYGQDATFALYSIAYLNTCFKNVKKHVRFHIAYPISHPPVKLNSLLKMELKCNSNFNVDNLKPDKQRENFNNSDIPYPHNILRNIAITFSETPYVFVIDIDFVPSKNLYQNFQNFLQRRQSGGKTDKRAYVIPSFESRSSVLSPLTKSQLLQEWDSKNIRPFYAEVCWKCQKVTDYDQWRTLMDIGFLDIGYVVFWQDPWEPLYIARRSDLPLYDGRFKQYGFNRISQVCEMHMTGYIFAVINNGFVVHRGFKEEGKFHARKTEENERNKQHFRDYKKELKERYPQSKLQC